MKAKKVSRRVILTATILLILTITFLSTNIFTDLLDNFATSSDYELQKNFVTNLWGRITGAAATDEGAPPPITSATPVAPSGGGGSLSEIEEETIGPIISITIAVPEGFIVTEGEIIIKEFHGVCDENTCIEKEGLSSDHECATNLDCTIKADLTRESRPCTDTDTNNEYPNGRDPFKKGSTEAERKGGLDNCISSTKLEEYFCYPIEKFKLLLETIDCSSFEGFVCVDGECIPSEDPDKCTDTDDLDYFTKGQILQSGKSIREDKCAGQTTLQENYCDKKNNPSVKVTHCEGPPGEASCINGACIPFTESEPRLHPSEQKNPITTIITGFFSRFFDLKT